MCFREPKCVWRPGFARTRWGELKRSQAGIGGGVRVLLLRGRSEGEGKGDGRGRQREREEEKREGVRGRDCLLFI